MELTDKGERPIVGRPKLFKDRSHINVACEEPMIAWLFDRAGERGISLSQFVRELVGKEIASYERRKARRAS